MHNINIYILVMGVTTFAVRFLPMFLLRSKIKSIFIRSFLYYVPYVTLAVMTFPSIIDVTRSPLAGGLALVGGVVAAWKKCSMIVVAMICCAIVLVSELVLV